MSQVVVIISIVNLTKSCTSIPQNNNNNLEYLDPKCSSGDRSFEEIFLFMRCYSSIRVEAAFWLQCGAETFANRLHKEAFVVPSDRVSVLITSPES